MSIMSLSLLKERLRTWYLPLRQQVQEQLIASGMLHEHSDFGTGFQHPERFLQMLWNEQRFAVSPLRTVDGRTVEVISPGTWNLEAGPDFKNAFIVIGGSPARGEVEIHRTTMDWFRHGHHNDNAYNNVILHVVYADDSGITRQQTSPLPPCLTMVNCLDRPLQDLVTILENGVYPYARCVAPGDCAFRFAMADEDKVKNFLHTAGLARFAEKRLHYERMIKEEGADETFYRGFFDALGYKANRQPFGMLASSIRLRYLRQLPNYPSRLAALFGTAGLLRDPSTAPLSKQHRDSLRHLWDLWWAQALAPLELRWISAGVRPPNRPEMRLAAGAKLLQKLEFNPTEKFTALAAASSTPAELMRNLKTCLSTAPQETDDLLDWLEPDPRRRLLGDSRIHDILVNVLLPLLSAAGHMSGNLALAERAEETYLTVPRLQDNRLLKEAAHRLLVPPSRIRDVVQGACDQQGLLEIHRDFCLKLGNDCKNCPLGKGSMVEDQVLTQ